VLARVVVEHQEGFLDRPRDSRRVEGNEVCRQEHQGRDPQDFVRRHPLFPALEQGDDLVFGQELACALHIPVDGEGGGHHHSHLHDSVDLGDLFDLRGQGQGFDRLTSVSLKRLALGATGT